MWLALLLQLSLPCVVSVTALLRCRCFLRTIHMMLCMYEGMSRSATISRLVLGFGLLGFDISFLATYSFHGGVSMRGEYERERAGCDDGTGSLTGHLRGRRSSAGCGRRRFCNVFRELASSGWDHPTPPQLQLQIILQINRISKCASNLLRMAGQPSVSVFSKKIWK